MAPVRNETRLANPDFKRCLPNIFSPYSQRGSDSNRRPLGYEPNELPTALPRGNKNSQKWQLTDAFRNTHSISCAPDRTLETSLRRSHSTCYRARRFLFLKSKTKSKPKRKLGCFEVEEPCNNSVALKQKNFEITRFFEVEELEITQLF